MKPSIVDRSETILVGLVTRGGDIGALWDEFSPVEAAIKNSVPGAWYEYHVYPREGTSGDPFYLAGIEVTKVEDLPEMLFVKVLSAGRYAVFTHDFAAGGYDVLNARIRDWIAAGPYKLAGSASLQRYDERFKGIGVPESVLELMVRIEPK